jgi:hypothetical protein
MAITLAIGKEHDTCFFLVRPLLLSSASLERIDLMNVRTTLILFSLFQLSASILKAEVASLGPCQQVGHACSTAGFVVGKAGEGYGYWAHCINPLMQGVSHPAGAIKPLPVVPSSVILACKAKAPHWGEGPVGFVASNPPTQNQPASNQVTNDSNQEGNSISMNKKASYSADSAIKYYKFLRTLQLPEGKHFIKAIKGKVQLQHTGDYSLSLNTIFSVPGNCPKETVAPFTSYDQLGNFMGQATYNLAQFILRGNSQAKVNIQFPEGVPVSGCIVIVFDGGPEAGSSDFTMSANLKFEMSPEGARANPAILTSGWEDWIQGKNAFAFSVPIGFKSELAGLYGSYSMIGTNDSKIDYYLLPGGCGAFLKKGVKGMSQYMTSNMSINQMEHNLPANAKLLFSFEKRGRGLIQDSLSVKPESTVNLEAGDCLLSVMYSPSGKLEHGDFENQLKYFLVPR